MTMSDERGRDTGTKAMAKGERVERQQNGREKRDNEGERKGSSNDSS